MDRCLLDTCTISDVIRPTTKRLPVVSQHVKQYLRAHSRFAFSEISCYEILRGLRKKQAVSQQIQFTDFCRRSEVLPVTYEVLDRAASLWAEGQRQGKVVDDVDIIIAATSVLQRLPLATANTRHFEWISGLSLVDWREP